MIIRTEYMNVLRTYRDIPLVKILAGIRRSGKSTILAMLQEDDFVKREALLLPVRLAQRVREPTRRHAGGLVVRKHRRAAQRLAAADRLNRPDAPRHLDRAIRIGDEEPRDLEVLLQALRERRIPDIHRDRELLVADTRDVNDLLRTAHRRRKHQPNHYQLFHLC